MMPARRRARQEDITPEERQKIDAFIASGRVIKCPSCFTPELAEMNRKETHAYINLSPKEKGELHRKKFQWRGKRSTLSPEEKKERARKNAAAYYAKNKDRLRAEDRQRRQKRKGAKVKACAPETQA